MIPRIRQIPIWLNALDWPGRFHPAFRDPVTREVFVNRAVTFSSAAAALTYARKELEEAATQLPSLPEYSAVLAPEIEVAVA